MFYSAMRKDILGRWREYFKDLLNPVATTSLDAHEVHLGEEYAITAAEVLLAVKTLKARKAATKSYLKFSKT